MTRYTVVWLESTKDELAELWLDAPNRNAVTTAVDQQLAENPSMKDAELREGLRSFFAPPLKAIFTVREEDRIVEVLRVRFI